jgi:hypothetical protein
LGVSSRYWLVENVLLLSWPLAGSKLIVLAVVLAVALVIGWLETWVSWLLLWSLGKRTETYETTMFCGQHPRYWAYTKDTHCQ